MIKTYPNHRGAYFEGAELRSPAFIALTGKAAQVLCLIYAKRDMKKVRGKIGRSEHKTVTNSGQIVFTYAEALTYGIKRQQFSRALDQLVAFGWVEISVTGLGLGRAVNKIAISDRWRKFGQEDFEVIARKKRTQPARFEKGNSFGGACPKSGIYGTP